MDKPILFCDCDGVILNTIEVAYGIMQRMNINISNRVAVDKAFKVLMNWNEIFNETKIINDSVNKIMYLKKQNIFKDIVVLTKLSGGYDEERLKREFFSEYLPDTKVVTLQYGLSKGLVVPANGNILVDDEIGNCRRWKEENGTAVLFSEYMSNLDEDIVSNLIDVPDTKSVKTLIKTRYF